MQKHFDISHRGYYKKVYTVQWGDPLVWVLTTCVTERKPKTVFKLYIYIGYLNTHPNPRNFSELRDKEETIAKMI
jgi:hypothetical protein